MLMQGAKDLRSGWLNLGLLSTYVDPPFALYAGGVDRQGVSWLIKAAVDQGLPPGAR